MRRLDELGCHPTPPVSVDTSATGISGDTRTRRLMLAFKRKLLTAYNAAIIILAELPAMLAHSIRSTVGDWRAYLW
jgi:hypothetical protein